MRRYHPHGRHDREVGEGARVEAAPADVPVQDEARPVLDVEQQRIGRVDIIADERIELVWRVGERISWRVSQSK